MTPRDPQGPQGSPPMSSQGCPGGPPPSQGLLGVPWRTLGGAVEVTWGTLGSSWEALGEARRSSGCDLEFFKKRFASLIKPSILKLGRVFGETRGRLGGPLSVCGSSESPLGWPGTPRACPRAALSAPPGPPASPLGRPHRGPGDRSSDPPPGPPPPRTRGPVWQPPPPPWV